MKQTSRLIACVTAAWIVSLVTTAQAQPATSASAPAAEAVASSPKAIRAANRQLCKAVRLALTRTRGLDSQNIATVCHTGVVSLAGTVPDASQIDVAVTAAKGVKDVVTVNNTLAILHIGE
jgi:hyperosmotically inducible periplasmic protein